jgi:DNA invertase Pin-like site-specific DNA recombinase
MIGTSSARRAVIYVRVSGGKQDHANQLPELRQVATTRNLEVVTTYAETASTKRRLPELDRLMADAHAGKFGVLLVWAIDRLGRSMVGNLATILQLDRMGVVVVSLKEPWLDTGGPVRQLLIAIFSWVAEQERTRLGERTRAGLERARAEGKRLGRPRAQIDIERAREMMATGSSLRGTAKELGVGVATLSRALAVAA